MGFDVPAVAFCLSAFSMDPVEYSECVVQDKLIHLSAGWQCTVALVPAKLDVIVS